MSLSNDDKCLCGHPYSSHERELFPSVTGFFETSQNIRPPYCRECDCVVFELDEHFIQPNITFSLDYILMSQVIENVQEQVGRWEARDLNPRPHKLVPMSAICTCQHATGGHANYTGRCLHANCRCFRFEEMGITPAVPAVQTVKDPPKEEPKPEEGSRWALLEVD